MIRVETIPGTNIVIARGVLDRGLVRDAQAESLELLSPVQHADAKSAEGGYCETMISTDLLYRKPGFQAMNRVLEIVGIDEGDDAIVGVNFQGARGVQRFHPDNPTSNGGFRIVHCADGGAFDFHQTELDIADVDEGYKSVEVGAGDLVIQGSPWVLHRGRNLGDEPRVTLAIGKITGFIEEWSTV